MTGTWVQWPTAHRISVGAGVVAVVGVGVWWWRRDKDALIRLCGGAIERTTEPSLATTATATSSPVSAPTQPTPKGRHIPRFTEADLRRRAKEEVDDVIEVAMAANASSENIVVAKMTVIVTTSPVQSNPCTEMIEALLQSFELVPNLVDCAKIIVCDGVREGATNKYRSGQVTTEKQVDYDGYVDRLAALCTAGSGAFINSSVIRLRRRRGFGFAVKAALSRVTTKFVMVVQHDRSFVATFPLVDVLAAMDADPALKYVGLCTSSTLNYAHKIRSKYNIALTPRTVCGVEFTPMVYWYDSTHIATAKHYHNFVFGPRRLTKGNFIEADLGQVQIKEILVKGMAAHAEYGTFLLGSGDSRVVAHVHGRGFLNDAAAAALEARNKRARSDAASPE